MNKSKLLSYTNGKVYSFLYKEQDDKYIGYLSTTIYQFREYIKSQLPDDIKFEDFKKTWVIKNKLSSKIFNFADDNDKNRYYHYSNFYVSVTNKCKYCNVDLNNHNKQRTSFCKLCYSQYYTNRYLAQKFTPFENNKIKPIYKKHKRSKRTKRQEVYRSSFQKFYKFKNPNNFSDLVGCTQKFFKEYIESQFESWMNWDNFKKEWIIDHVIPISAVDIFNIKEVREVFHYSNCRPLAIHLNQTRPVKRLNYDKTIKFEMLNNWQKQKYLELVNSAVQFLDLNLIIPETDFVPGKEVVVNPKIKEKFKSIIIYGEEYNTSYKLFRGLRLLISKLIYWFKSKNQTNIILKETGDFNLIENLCGTTIENFVKYLELSYFPENDEDDGWKYWEWRFQSKVNYKDYDFFKYPEQILDAFYYENFFIQKNNRPWEK